MGLTGPQQVALMFTTTVLEEDAHTVRACLASIQDAQERMRRGGIQLPGQPDPRQQAAAEMNQSAGMLEMVMPRLLGNCVRMHQIMGGAGQETPPQEPANGPKLVTE